MGSHKGEDFEARVKADLESKGWFVVRSAGSRGPADLVAVKATEFEVGSYKGGRVARADRRLALVQCDVTAGPLPSINWRKWNRVYEAAGRINARAVVASRIKVGREFRIVYNWLKHAKPEPDAWSRAIAEEVGRLMREPHNQETPRSILRVQAKLILWARACGEWRPEA